MMQKYNLYSKPGFLFSREKLFTTTHKVASFWHAVQEAAHAKKLDGVDLSHKTLHGLVIKNQTIRNVIFDEADLQNSTFENVIFENCSFRDTKLRNATLTKTVFRDCQMSLHSDESSTHFRGSDMKEVAFENCGGDISLCHIHAEKLAFRNCAFSKTFLTKYDPSRQSTPLQHPDTRIDGLSITASSMNFSKGKGENAEAIITNLFSDNDNLHGKQLANLTTTLTRSKHDLCAPNLVQQIGAAIGNVMDNSTLGTISTIATAAGVMGAGQALPENVETVALQTTGGISMLKGAWDVVFNKNLSTPQRLAALAPIALGIYAHLQAQGKVAPLPEQVQIWLKPYLDKGKVVTGTAETATETAAAKPDANIETPTPST